MVDLSIAMLVHQRVSRNIQKPSANVHQPFALSESIGFPSSVAHLFLAHFPWVSTWFIVSFNASSTCLYKVYWRSIPWYGCSIMNSFKIVMTWEQIPHDLTFRITGSYTIYLDLRYSILDISITYSYTWNCYVNLELFSTIMWKLFSSATMQPRLQRGLARWWRFNGTSADSHHTT